MTWLLSKKKVASLSEPQDMLLKLARRMDDRDMDWQDMRARCKRLLDRTEKAARVIDSGHEQTAEVTPDGDGTTPGLLPVVPFTARHKVIKQQILKIT